MVGVLLQASQCIFELGVGLQQLPPFNVLCQRLSDPCSFTKFDLEVEHGVMGRHCPMELLWLQLPI